LSPRVPIGLLAAQSDRRLVELVGEGHERAFEVLLKRYRRQLMRYCKRMGLAPPRAEDALQQAFLQAWLALERGVEVRAPKPWLYRIVHNSAVNVMRSSRQENRALLEGSLADSFESDLDSRLVARQTLSEVAALPSMQREAMLMSAVDGRSHEEVADALGITNGAVRGLLYRARSTLRDAAAALIPAPLVSWAAGCVSRGAPTAERLAELSAQGGGSTLARGAAMAVTAAVLAAGVVVVPHHGHPAQHAAPAGASRAAVAARGVATSARSPAVTVSATSTAPARRTASVTPSSTPSTGNLTPIATGSAPTAVTPHRRASTPQARSAPAPASTVPGTRGSSPQYNTPSQVSSIGVAATTPTSPPPPTTPAPTKTEETAPPPTGSGGEKAKEEPSDDGREPGSDDGHEESPEDKPEEPETPPKSGEKHHDE
jgi:RNA polymerase sigma factor (sigma-70 family)